ncbi:MAG: transposase [Nitrospira sp.]|nr:transposase [Nitrospira sp.]
MSKLRFTDDQIQRMMSELDAGQGVGEVSRRYGISRSTLYRWRAKFGHEQQPDDKDRLRSLQDEHRRLKRQFAELTLDYATLRAALIRDVRGDC